MIFWKWKRKIKVDKIKYVKSENTSRSVQMGTSVNKHPYSYFQVRWKASENRSENTTDWQRCIWKRGIKTQLQWEKIKGSPSSYFPNKICFWHVDHSENERSQTKKKTWFWMNVSWKKGVPGFPEYSLVQLMLLWVNCYHS